MALLFPKEHNIIYYVPSKTKYYIYFNLGGKKPEKNNAIHSQHQRIEIFMEGVFCTQPLSGWVF
jgi:hypothetical protein